MCVDLNQRMIAMHCGSRKSRKKYTSGMILVEEVQVEEVLVVEVLVGRVAIRSRGYPAGWQRPILSKMQFQSQLVEPA